MTDQLTLNMQLRDDATFDSYYSGDNHEAYVAVQAISQGKGEKFIYLWGKEGSGGSHLLQAACLSARSLGVPSIYYSIKDPLFTPEIIKGLENISLVCIDDIQSIAGKKPWEEAFFHLFNRIRSEGTRLLVASDIAPLNLAIELPDLKSRLAWGITYHLKSMNDEQKLAALVLRAKIRGLELNKSVGQYLLSHCPRNMNDLFATLEQLDQASLAEQRKLTIPFVKEVLGIY